MSGLTEPVRPPHSPDTPRRASTLVGRQVALATAVLVGLAAVAWYLTALQIGGMHGMAMGLAQVGSRLSVLPAAPVFGGMWLTMMVAMMFPTIVPMVLAHRGVVLRRGEGSLPTFAFVAGYLLVWTAIGIVPLTALLVFRHLAAGTEGDGWIPVVAGAVLAVAGVYQFTSWKWVCLSRCRSPLAFVVEHDFRTGARGALRVGITHGAWCLGCCWALMTVLVVVGLMNLVWMATLALVFLIEKNWKHGVPVTRVVGVGLIIFGLVVVAVPETLPTISRTSEEPPTMQMAPSS